MSAAGTRPTPPKTLRVPPGILGGRSGSLRGPRRRRPGGARGDADLTAFDLCVSSYWMPLSVFGLVRGGASWKWILDVSGLQLKYGFLFQTWIAADLLNRLVPFLLPIPPLGAAYRFGQTARVVREGIRPAVVIVIDKDLRALFRRCTFCGSISARPAPS